MFFLSSTRMLQYQGAAKSSTEFQRYIIFSSSSHQKMVENFPSGKSFASSIHVLLHLIRPNKQASFTRMNFASPDEILKPIRESHKLIRNRSEFTRQKNNNQLSIFSGLKRESFMHKCKRKARVCGYFITVVLLALASILMLAVGSGMEASF